MSSHHPAYTMAGLATAGGLIGYARTKSVPSLFAGLAFGSMFAFSGYTLQAGAPVTGNSMAVAAAAFLSLTMLGRAIKTRGPVPISLSVLGLSSLGYHSYKLMQLKELGHQLWPPKD